MAGVFISYSSKDKDFATRLKADLVAGGHRAWIDSDEIMVGDSIPRKIEKGLADADFVVLVLSPNSVRSKWVEREWQSRFSEEVQTGQPIILPVLCEDCDRPPWIADKKFADCRTNYTAGFVELCKALDSFSLVETKIAGTLSQQPVESMGLEATRLLCSLGDPDTRLSAIVPEILAFAQSTDDMALMEYCKIQLEGMCDRSYSVEELPVWVESRAIKTYVGSADLNPSFVGWGGSVDAMWHHIHNDPSFSWIRFVVPDPVHWIEQQADSAKRDTILRGTIPAEGLNPKTKNPGKRYVAYMRWDAYRDVVVKIRQDLVRLVTQYAH
ncbi:MAG: toll/interleukin-1 receptor domain-containing protein [Phycisphaerales bacterium]|nr:toll/interleukin-1 receptor domain-containing protein [Phycisphaerales bacterium]